MWYGTPQNKCTACRDAINPQKFTFCVAVGCNHIIGWVLNTLYKLLNLRALKYSHVNEMHIFQCMGKRFCVQFQRVPLKFHTKYLTHILNDTIFIQHWYRKCFWSTPRVTFEFHNDVMTWKRSPVNFVNFPYRGLVVWGFNGSFGVVHVVKQAVRRHDAHVTSI